MATRFQVRFARALLAIAAGITLISPIETQAAEGWPASVQASYDVNFNGIGIGTYDFQSAQDGQTYKLAGTAKLSLLLGAIHWSGVTHATGKMSGETAKPQVFGFEYQAQSKTGSTQMSFTGDSVTQVLHTPMPQLKEGLIPVQPQHLKGVLDPLSAVLALSKGSLGNPCGRRIPIYDGHQRFDLVMTAKGQIQIAERGQNGESGQSATGYVCKVRYVPIAGYKPDDQSRYMQQNNDIEIILRAIPGIGIFIPHQISIPTMAGAATLVARRVHVTTNTRQQFALITD